MGRDDAERRRWERLPTDIPLELHLVDSVRGGRTMTALGTHLNPEGIFVQLADPPPVGTMVRVTVAASGIEGSLSADGEVVYQLFEDDRRDGPTGCGVHVRSKGPAWLRLYEWLSSSTTE